MAGNISRRDFIKKSAVGVVAGTVILSSLDLSKLAAASKPGAFQRSGDDIIVKLSDSKNAALATAGGSVMLDDDNILIRMSQTQFLAVNLICRHKGCTVELQGDKFVCPCHGSEYTLEGKVTNGPAKSNLKTFEAIFDSDKGTVTVKMDKSDLPEKKETTDSTKTKDK
jgi:cytochrome b6-f complex iron-sulfur subunit